MSSKTKKSNGLVTPIPNTPEHQEAILKGLDMANARMLVHKHYTEKEFSRVHQTIKSLRRWLTWLIVLTMLAATGTVCNLMLDAQGVL